MPKDFLGKTIPHYSYHDYGRKWAMDLISSLLVSPTKGFPLFADGM